MFRISCSHKWDRSYSMWGLNQWGVWHSLRSSVSVELVPRFHLLSAIESEIDQENSCCSLSSRILLAVSLHHIHNSSPQKYCPLASHIRCNPLWLCSVTSPSLSFFLNSLSFTLLFISNEETSESNPHSFCAQNYLQNSNIYFLITVNQIIVSECSLASLY